MLIGLIIYEQIQKKCRDSEHRKMVFSFKGKPWISNLTPRKVTPVFNYLDAICTPALIYNGENDMQDFKNAAQTLKIKMPSTYFAEIPNSGAFPGWEAPQYVNLLVHKYLSQFLKSDRFQD